MINAQSNLKLFILNIDFMLDKQILKITEEPIFGGGGSGGGSRMANTNKELSFNIL